MPQGPLIILSGPSGVGKSTVIRKLLDDTGLPLHLSVSATTRPPRPGEREGVDYFFRTPEQFQQEIDRGGFLEWAEVHGRRYGTLRGEVDAWLARGWGVLLDIDVQGAELVRRKCPGVLSIFLKASSWEVYEERLRKRHTENEEMIARRLATARRELERAGEYDFQVMNVDLDAAVAEVRGLIARRFEKGDDMLDELKEEGIVNKVGGRFKLSTLIQKRMVALNKGARPLVEVRGGDKMAVVVQEILQDKIYLDASGAVQARGMSPGDIVRRAMMGDVSADLSSAGDD